MQWDAAMFRPYLDSDSGETIVITEGVVASETGLRY